MTFHIFYCQKMWPNVISLFRLLFITIPCIIKSYKTSLLNAKQRHLSKHQQYHSLKIIYNEDYHDRYFILDREAKTVFINKIVKIIEESP